MTTRGKSINLFLMDGAPTGRIKVTLANGTGVSPKIPRTELETCKSLAILKQSGVYFLFGTTDDPGENVVYIGQTGVRRNGDGILLRLLEHKRNPEKDYWTEAVVFTTSNNSFGPTEISYLENRFCGLAFAAKRYDVRNGNDPTHGNITEGKESELEEFVDYSHKVFEPVVSAKPVTPVDEHLAVEEPLLIFNRSSQNATGRRTSEGFVIFKGSAISADLQKSCPENVIKLRERYESEIDANQTLTEDILFSSPSAAAAFVGGSSLNGNELWKTEDGTKLKKLEKSGEK